MCRWNGALAHVCALLDRIDATVVHSSIGRYFYLDGSGNQLSCSGAKFSTEIRAGLVTFTTMAYILSVNANTPS